MLEFSSTESCSTGATSSPLSGFSSNVSSCDGNVALINDFESTEGCSGQGPQGPQGFSAYQIAVFEGFVGTEEEWLASLVGPQGPVGPIGPQGPIGLTGPGVPVGGTIGQILAKIDSTNYNTQWINNFALPSLTSGSVLFSNGTTIAQDNSNFFWDDTNNRLGIGTNAPAVTFDVTGIGRITNGARFNNVGIAYGPWGQNALEIGTNGSHFIIQATNGGNTSINSVADLGAKLGIKVGGAAITDVALRIRDSGNTFNLANFDGSGRVILNANYSAGGGVGTLIMNTTDTATDNIGPVLTFAGNYTGTTPVNFAMIRGAKSPIGGQRGYLSFHTDGSGASLSVERMRVDWNGNVGIGISTPAYKLDVFGTARFGNGFIFDTDAGSRFFSSSTIQYQCNNGTLQHRFTNQSGPSLTGILFQIDTGGSLSTNPVTLFRILNQSTEVLNIKAGGNVLIGTATDNGGKLQIGTAPTASANYGTLSIGGGAFNGSTSGYFIGSTLGNSIAVNEVSGYTGNLIALQIAGIPKLTVDTNGLGFGNRNYISNGGWGGTNLTTNTSIRFTNYYNSGIVYLSIDASNGNVGVGTASSTANLQVVQITSGIGTVTNLAGGSTVTGSGTQFTNTFKIGDTITIGGQTVAISAIASNTSMTTATITLANTAVAYTLVGGTRFSVLGNGNVGIGTTAPTSVLHVIGAVGNATKITTSGYSNWSSIVSFNNTSAGGFFGLDIGAYSDVGGSRIINITGNNTTDIYLPNGISATNWNLYSCYYNNYWQDATLYLRNTTGGLGGFKFTSVVTGVLMSILENGNVGIGTTTPIAIFQVKTTTANTNSSIALLNNNGVATIGAITDTGSALTMLQFRADGINFTDLGTNGIVIASTGYTLSANATAILDVRSTTKGFLPPRMTNAERLAIVTPAVGLMVYCTDVVEGVYVNKSTGWTFIA